MQLGTGMMSLGGSVMLSRFKLSGMLQNVQPKSCLSVDLQHFKRALLSDKTADKVSQNLHTQNQAMQVVDFVKVFACVGIEWE